MFAKSKYKKNQMLIKSKSLWLEVGVRVALVILFVCMEKLQPFERKIHPEEMWLYKNPMTASYIPASLLWPIVVFAPLVVIFTVFLLRKPRTILELVQALLAFSLALGLNGLVTDVMKLIVGRPRPDFFFRCFPDGISNPEMHCTGDPAIITEGRKSFPSGHSSFSFVSLGFISLYLAGKLGVFNDAGRNKSIRLLVSFFPLLMALMIALSRTCDYHHHWQDVLCGSLIGFTIAYLCYRQHYPSLDSPNADVPLVQILGQSNGNSQLLDSANVLSFKDVV